MVPVSNKTPRTIPTMVSVAPSHEGQAAAPAPVAFQDGADFISFDFGDADGNESENDGASSSSSSASGDQLASGSSSVKGKGKAVPRGKKRSIDDRTADEGEYRNRKDERRAASRTVPWADDVDWRSCRTPAEMYVAAIITRAH